MSSWQSAFINTNGIRLHYTRTGGPHPPLVLAHGFTQNAHAWGPLLPILATRHEVVAVDL